MSSIKAQYRSWGIWSQNGAYLEIDIWRLTLACSMSMEMFNARSTSPQMVLSEQVKDRCIHIQIQWDLKKFHQQNPSPKEMHYNGNRAQSGQVGNMLLPGHYLQILETRDVMKCFSAHYGIHSFAPIWHIFSKCVPYGCKTMYARMCRKTIHELPSF